MELHLVHRDEATGAPVVLAVLVQPGGAANSTLDAILKAAPADPAAPPSPLQLPFSLLSLLPRPADGQRHYATYRGSLTTPPCSEGVEWFVFLDPLHVSADQILAFQFYVGGGTTLGLNTRPVQPLGERMIQYFV